MNSLNKMDAQAWIFTIKCIIGVAICYYFYVQWPQYPFEWAIISVGLGLSFDNTNKAATDRMVANIIGCIAGIVLFPTPIPQLLQLSTGVILIVAVGFFFNISYTVRAGITAFVIVMVQNKSDRSWFIPLERVLTTLVGCLVAFLLTFVFNLFLVKDRGSKAVKE
ncbi:FUSC family protein [Mucilaginibacter aquaedulcis]|uniref:FUSC family protein n=1 Tax=Mucilaginibacter aquaedulcis TaxID=1187081 RepID=UPI0025B4BAF8|nr:FUSC family protein [Mucilaginibacter aquaedulcis]MDN3549165.1 FUSC family protein [Mucilaginibacter aquaedulcis]